MCMGYIDTCCSVYTCLKPKHRQAEPEQLEDEMCKRELCIYLVQAAEQLCICKLHVQSSCVLCKLHSEQLCAMQAADQAAVIHASCRAAVFRASCKAAVYYDTLFRRNPPHASFTRKLQSSCSLQRTACKLQGSCSLQVAASSFV